jgi:hypothetical protein
MASRAWTLPGSEQGATLPEGGLHPPLKGWPNYVGIRNRPDRGQDHHDKLANGHAGAGKRVSELERVKMAALDELAQLAQPPRDLDIVLRTALSYLQNPLKL